VLDTQLAGTHGHDGVVLVVADGDEAVPCQGHDVDVEVAFGLGQELARRDGRQGQGRGAEFGRGRGGAGEQHLGHRGGGEGGRGGSWGRLGDAAADDAGIGQRFDDDVKHRVLLCLCQGVVRWGLSRG